MIRAKAFSAVTNDFHYDRILILVCGCLLIIGYVMVSSASMHLGAKMTGDSFHYPIKQLIHIVIGLLAAFAVMAIKLEVWQRCGQGLFILGLMLLVMVLIPGLGVKVNGSVRWLSLGGLRIQVSEVVKFVSVIYMAGYLTRHREAIRTSVYGMLRPLLLFSLASLLLLLEPDFGSAVVIMIIALGLMFLAGARISQFAVLLSVLSIAAILLIYLSPYRWARVTSFINPWADPLDSGFQLIQALISFGRGEWLGVGLGSGIQKLFYLPEAHTDFLFSVIAEELGLIGVALIITLFVMLVWRAFAIAIKAEQAGRMFSAYVAYGLGIWFGFQAFVNMGVNMGMLPTKGLTLPLMSYGGGSMIIMCAAMALLLRIYSEIEELRASVPKRKPQWINAS